MKKGWVLTQEDFDRLLYWLDADRDQAGKKYEEIRRRLIKLFTCRGCADAEELADETLNRVAGKVDRLAGNWDKGEQARYFCGVAQKVHLEYLRRIPAQRELTESAGQNYSHSPHADYDDGGAEYRCLDQCLDRLLPASRELVIRYYQSEKAEKIEQRKLFAAELGIAVNALRIRAHRIRLALQRCVKDCLEQQPAH